MDKKHFKDLLESVRQMKQIQKGRQKPARVIRMDPVFVKAIRHELQQSQTEFACMIGVSPSTLRNWEQGLRQPEGAAVALLTVARKNPQLVYEALHG